VVLLVVDVPGALRDTRDWLLETFGLGLAIITGLGAALSITLLRNVHRDQSLFARQVAGWGALGLFLWGCLGLNHSDWSLWATDFQQVSLGGGIGEWLVSGFFALIAWMGFAVIAAAMLAPRASVSFARSAPIWARYTWDHRWPHTVALGIWRTLAWFGRGLAAILAMPLSRNTEDDDGPVIGAVPAAAREPVEGDLTTSLRERLGALEAEDDDDVPAPFQPASRPVALAVPPASEEDDAPEAVIGAKEDNDEGPGEPMQLGLELHTGKPRWQLPALEMLNAPLPATHRKHDNKARASLIVDTLSSFGVDASVVEVNEGPTVTQFGVEPGWEVKYKDLLLKDPNGKSIVGADGRARTERVETSRQRVRVNRITALQNDLALALAAPSLRIEAPVPGRAIVGIEVPNDSATVVTMRSVMETKDFEDSLRKSKLTMALGRGVAGSPVVADLAKMPHLLIAGATGSGKSVCLNSIVAGIMMNASPDDVRFVMVDPKRVEMVAYEKIPHLVFSEVIVDVDKVVGVLQAVVAEMESRYKKFASMAVRNIDGYNKHPRILKKLPYWVVVIDELADLMMAAPMEVEKLICRLAQLARATGIHLVVATQRPSVDVVTGLIKANFPTRIAFAVTSQIDSRTILDTGGAEKLLGRGDMLFMPTDAAKPIRIQGVYLSDAEVERIVQFWTDDRFADLAPEKADALLEEALIERNGGDADIDLDEDDPLLDRARQLTRQHSRVSPSLFQRRLQVGYVKAARIMEALEDEGLVGSREEGESRRVITPSGIDTDRLVDLDL